MNCLILILTYQSSSDEIIGNIVIGGVGFLLIYALSRLFRKKPINIAKDQSLTSTAEDKIKDLNTETLDSLDEQKYNLLDLRKKNLFSEEEYNEKLNILNQKKDEIIKNMEEAERLKQRELLNIYVTQQIEPTVSKLRDLLNKGVITQDEFNEKKELIFLEKKIQIEDIHRKIQRRIDFYKLRPEWLKRSVRDLYIKSNGENVILYNWERESVFSFTHEEFRELSNTNEFINYYYIVLPENFNPKLVK